MHVVIVGCGRVGSSLALGLLEAGASVAVVDRRAEAFERLGKAFGGAVVEGVGFDRDVLTAAGIEGAVAVAAVTSGDNSNVLAARVARETFGVERVVARIYDPRRAAVYQRLGISTVATVAWTTEQIFRRVLPSADAVEWVDASARVSLVERSLGQGWVGHRVADIEVPGQVRVVTVTRLGQAMLPTPDLVAQSGDVAHLAVAVTAMPTLAELLAGPGRRH